MNLHFFIVFAVITVGDAAVIDYNQVQPFAQPKPATISEKAAVKFKPQLHITNGCYPYAAVNSEGDTSGGLQPTKTASGSCKESSYGAQMYARSTWFKGVWAIMYSWYFPKDSPTPSLGRRHDWKYVIVWLNSPAVKHSKMIAVSVPNRQSYSKYKPPSPDTVDGTSIKVNYESNWPKYHMLEMTTEKGEFQDLITWGQMTEAARTALQRANFGSSEVPMKNGNFLPNLHKAWPF